MPIVVDSSDARTFQDWTWRRAGCFIRKHSVVRSRCNDIRSAVNGVICLSERRSLYAAESKFGEEQDWRDESRRLDRSGSDCFQGGPWCQWSNGQSDTGMEKGEELGAFLFNLSQCTITFSDRDVAYALTMSFFSRFEDSVIHSHLKEKIIVPFTTMTIVINCTRIWHHMRQQCLQ